MNRQQFYLKMTLSALLRRRSRMLVALLAIAVGATILSGLITIYYDIPAQMGKEFRSYGANLILIPQGMEQTIPLERVAQAARFLPADSIAGIAPYRYQLIKINEQPFMAAGTELPEARKTSPYWFVEGRWPQAPGEVLIGQEVAARIRLSPGSDFTITGSGGILEGRDFRVAGIVQTGGTEEAFVFMSLEDFAAMTGGGGAVDLVECSISASRETMESIVSRINVEVPGVEAQLVRRLTESEGAVLTKLQALVYLVTVIIVLLIMICVATTMMAVVTERRKEIGLRKALGAPNGSLVAEFLGEGIFLGGFGGLLGALLGFLFAQGVGLNVFKRAVSFNPLLVPVTVLASILITGIACIIPVRSATGVDPAVVLRGE
ncbi:MAG: ABC transporter permease [Spirochaetaceae bacterium]|jgi:putative ABC transport system permease protein|nr:ABC transporter permease [Spirochaetaceae bacterium]